MNNHETLQTKASNKADQLAKEGSKSVKDIKDKAEDTWDEVSHQIEKKASDACDAIGGYVKENPMMALGWAALTGAAITLLLRR